ncbi:MAG: trans-sulfuration enzyme family protein [Acidobacteriota bacterium]
MRFETRAIHAGQAPDPSTGATIPPVHFTTTYTQAAPGEHKGFEYSRTGNPTRQALEECLASLEEGEACAAFSSGLAATSAVLQTLRPGDGVVAGHDVYGGTFRLLDRVYRPWGLEFAQPEDASLEAYARAVTRLARPRLLWIETPTNPLLDLIDIGAAAELGKRHGLTVVVDNTFATPYLQRPLCLGADLVVHSTTKYLGGHSDVIGGAVIARDKAGLDEVRFLQNAAGAVPGPLDCYLVQRGLKTLAVRMDRHCSNAASVAKALGEARQVTAVLYPGTGGMVSFRIAGGLDAARRFCSRVRVFACAESLGGVESLCGHPATMTHASVPAEARRARGITDDLIRLSVGLENAEDLIEDLRQALK